MPRKGKNVLTMWNQAEINRLLASIAHTIPPMTEEGFEKVEEWYNRGLPTTKQWTARQLFKKYKQLTTGDATGQGGGLCRLDARMVSRIRVFSAFETSW